MAGSMIVSLFIVAFPLTMITIQYSHVLRLYTQKRRRKRMMLEAQRRREIEARARKQAAMRRFNGGDDDNGSENGSVSSSMLEASRFSMSKVFAVPVQRVWTNLSVLTNASRKSILVNGKKSAAASTGGVAISSPLAAGPSISATADVDALRQLSADTVVDSGRPSETNGGGGVTSSPSGIGASTTTVAEAGRALESVIVINDSDGSGGAGAAAEKTAQTENNMDQKKNNDFVVVINRPSNDTRRSDLSVNIDTVTSFPSSHNTVLASLLFQKDADQRLENPDTAAVNSVDAIASGGNDNDNGDDNGNSNNTGNGNTDTNNFTLRSITSFLRFGRSPEDTARSVSNLGGPSSGENNNFAFLRSLASKRPPLPPPLSSLRQKRRSLTTPSLSPVSAPAPTENNNNSADIKAGESSASPVTDTNYDSSISSTSSIDQCSSPTSHSPKPAAPPTMRVPTSIPVMLPMSAGAAIVDSHPRPDSSGSWRSSRSSLRPP
ncbi:hypothetical protein HK102_010729, partial [Quaeritorhiza haematococci]